MIDIEAIIAKLNDPGRTVRDELNDPGRTVRDELLVATTEKST